MPQVKLLGTAVGRYDAKTGELLNVTDEEFARWAPSGLVALADSKEAKEAPAVEAPHSDGDLDQPVTLGAGEPVAEAPAEAPPARRPRSRKPKSG